MCIFANTVESVSNTRIAVCPLPGGALQLTVYENKAFTSTPNNAMILPVPWGPQGVKLINMQGYPGFWDDLELYFPQYTSVGFGGGANFAGKGSGWGMKAPLPVHQFGGYKCSVVPSIDDIDRINTTVFTLPEDIKQLLGEHYAQGFGFVVCLFDGRIEGHPIAYISHTLPSGNLFIPTMHEHGEEETQWPTGNPWTSDGLRSSDKHTDTYCDGCGAQDFSGTRWRCANCPNDPGFDLCDSCHGKRTLHDPTHCFLEITKPLTSRYQEILRTQAPLLAGTLYDKPSRHTRGTMAEFDHHIYLINAVSMDIVEADRMKYSTVRNGNYIQWNRLGVSSFQVRSVQKLSVHGHYENKDFAAAPIR